MDVDAKILKTKILATRYGSRIAKYYKFPGKETVDRLQAIDLAKLAEDIRKTQTSEEDLKDFVKAAIYAKTPDFGYFETALTLYPHLIPYCVDAIVKEYQQAPRFNEVFLDRAIAFFRDTFTSYARNDYFRIQAARLLCSLDTECGEFLGLQLRDLNAAKEVVFAQVVSLLKDDLPRGTLLALLEKFGSYGILSKTALVHAVKRGKIVPEAEAKAIRRNIYASEKDAFVKQLVKI